MVEPQGQHELYQQAMSSIAEVPPNVLKHGDSFAIIDRRGNIRPLGIANHGLFRDGTRFLSRLVMQAAGELPLLLSSTVGQDADFLSVDLTNAQIDATHTVLQDTVHFRQKSFLWNNTLYLHITIRNFGTETVAFPLSLEFAADYVDIFEVRGLARQQRGEALPPQVDEERVTLRYMGLDDIQRQTQLVFVPPPAALDAGQAAYEVRVDAGQHVTIGLTVACRYADEGAPTLPYEVAFEQVMARREAREREVCRLETSHTQFNEWLEASRRDVLLLLSDTNTGLYPYAGVPWFSTVFGRDGLITALQTLWFYPDVARGVLATLAAKQATSEDLTRESEPGKILHEERRGEMANTGEIPFGSYYGTIDATPLFIVLAGRYYQRTGDLDFIRELWPALEAALRWIDEYGDIDGDGFVEYRRKNERGILQQGWKDSNDSIFYEDGSLVRPPVALCEVQGYVYEAQSLAADIAAVLGHTETAESLRARATQLKAKFQEAFWLDDLGTYAVALDGKKRPCRVRTSNAGHCLYSGIATQEHARRITEQLLRPEFFSGWGIRTLATGEAHYNPMAYHNGSVWPHDNSLIAAGMARYGFKDAAAQVLAGLFGTSTHLDLYRLPELFCGFEQRHREGPTLYPVACLPQAWAAASVFLMVQACLGIRVEGRQQRIIFQQPTLPLGMDTLHIRRLPVGDTRVDLTLTRTEAGVAVAAPTEEIEVVIEQ